jgi:adenosylcobinamide-GDP ribazoletransferase
VSALQHAFRALTVLPVPPADRPASGWTAAAFPVVGFFVGLGWVLGSTSLRLFPRTTAVAAVLVLIIDALLTGGRHLRGVAGAADQLAGGGHPADEEPAPRPVRTAGAVALNLILLARFAALIVAAEFGALLLVVPIIGRAGLLVLAAQLPGEPLGLPRPPVPALALGLVLAGAGAALGGTRALIALALALVVAAVLGLAAQVGARRNPVASGELVWGGSCVVETVALLVLVAPSV